MSLWMSYTPITEAGQHSKYASPLADGTHGRLSFLNEQIWDFVACVPWDGIIPSTMNSFGSRVSYRLEAFEVISLDLHSPG